MANHLNRLTVVSNWHAGDFGYISNSINITTDTVLEDGSDVFYRTIRKQGLEGSMDSYSKELLNS